MSDAITWGIVLCIGLLVAENVWISRRLDKAETALVATIEMVIINSEKLGLCKTIKKEDGEWKVVASDGERENPDGDR